MYRSEYGLSASTVRISWVFGPPVISDQPMRGPIPSYLLRALRGEPIREGGADFAASFTYVADVAEALLAAAAAPELRHAIYHFGHGVNFTAGQAAEAVRKAVPGAVIELAGGTEPWTRYTAPARAARGRADSSRTPATRRRTRSRPASRPMRTGCAPIRKNGRADQVSGSMTCCAKAGRAVSRSIPGAQVRQFRPLDRQRVPAIGDAAERNVRDRQMVGDHPGAVGEIFVEQAQRGLRALLAGADRRHVALRRRRADQAEKQRAEAGHRGLLPVHPHLGPGARSAGSAGISVPAACLAAR